MSAPSLFVQFRMLVIYEYFICAREHITQKLVQKRTKWFLVDKPNSISRVCVYVVWSRVAGRWNVPRLLVQMERRYTNESVQPAIDCHRIRAHQSAQTRRSICVHEHDRLASCIRCWWQQQQVRVPTSFLVLINEIIMFRMVVNAVMMIMMSRMPRTSEMLGNRHEFNTNSGRHSEHTAWNSYEYYGWECKKIALKTRDKKSI